jgi:hypothetical protein
MRHLFAVLSGLSANLPLPDLVRVARNASTEVAVKEVSVVNQAPAGGSSQCRLSPLAHVLQPHHATASGDQ